MRIVSGIQPTGNIHIGNYLGAIKQWISLQEKNECVFCVVDLHAITTPFKPEEMQKNILESAIIYLAAGINPEKDLVEIIEIPNHPFFVASQFHPEFKSRPLRPHPLFREFIKAAIK